jgi:hypothetical protein
MAKTAFHWDDPLLLDQQLSELHPFAIHTGGVNGPA